MAVFRMNVTSGDERHDTYLDADTTYHVKLVPEDHGDMYSEVLPVTMGTGNSNDRRYRREGKGRTRGKSHTCGVRFDGSVGCRGEQPRGLIALLGD